MSSFLASDNAISIIRGSSRTIEIVVTDPDEVSNTNPSGIVNLTAATLYLTVKEKIEDPLAIIKKSSNSSLEIEITAPRSGLAKIYFVPADTQKREVGAYVYDLWVLLSSGKRFPIIAPSTFEITPGVTVIP